MTHCPHCDHEMPETLAQCAECGADLNGARSSSDSAWEASPSDPAHVPIARFANVAEAGYFHCELEGRAGCEIRLIAQNHFDAPSAAWGSCYVLTASAADAERARALLKQIVAETDQPEFDAQPEPFVSPSRAPQDELTIPESRIHWAPIVLTLTAGTFVVWAARQVPRHAREPERGRPGQVDVWKHLSENGMPWVQNLVNGRGKRELLIDPEGESATLREDRDGDGIFEQKARLIFVPAGRQ